MAEAKLFRVLKTFTKEEFKEFEKIIISPYFSTGRDLLPLYRYLRNYHPDYDSDKAVKGLNSEVIFKRMFPRQKWLGKKSVNTIDKLFSDTLKSAEEYLFQRAMKDWFPMEKYAYLSLALDGKLLGKETLEAAAKSDRLWEKYGIDSDFFRGKIHNESARVSVYLNMDQQIKVAENVFAVSENIVTYFFAMMAKCVRNMIANKATFNIEHKQVNAYRLVKLLDIDNAINIYSEKTGNYSEITMMYLYELKALLANNSDVPYYEFKKLFYKNFDKLSFSEKYDKFASLTSCILLLIEKNYKKFTKELFEINKYRLLKKAYKHSESLYFPVIIFRAIFFSALNAEEIVWAKNFLVKYIEEVIPEHRDSLKNICEAAILSIEQKHDKAIDKLNKVTDNLITFNFDKRVLALICYYELGYYENAISLLDASKHFLKNNKEVSAVNNLYYKKFFDVFAKLLKMTVSGDYENSLAVKNYTVSNLPVPFSTWIMKKLDTV